MESRKRLYHWLKKNVEAKNFGLRWIDREKQLFLIPWIHKHNKGWNKGRCQVFKEWAKVTNRYRDGDPEDWPGWKTRLRTALTKLPYFEEVHALHQLENAEHPYKVYRFVLKDKSTDVSDCASSTGGSPAFFQPVEFSPSCSQRVDISPSSSQQNDMSPHNSQCSDASPNSSQLQFTDVSQTNSQWMDMNPSSSQHADTLSGSVSSASPAFFDALSRSFNPDTMNNIFHLDHQEPTSVALAQHNQQNTWNILPTGQISNKEVDDHKRGCRAAGGRLPSDLVNVNLVMESRLPSSEMELYKREPKKRMVEFKIYYLDEEVKRGIIFDSGLHCYFGKIVDIPSNFYENMFGPKELEKFEFPDVNTISKSISHEQQNFLEDILLQLDRGFLLQFDEHGSMYARRLCRTRIFANNLLLGEKSICLDRKSEEYAKLFDVEAFKADVTSYSSVTNLTFAQDYKRSDTTRKILMRMELTHLDAQLSLEKFNPPSTTSLQFSDLNSGDQLLHQIKLLSIKT